MKNLNMDAYHFSISWSRLIPGKVIHCAEFTLVKHGCHHLGVTQMINFYAVSNKQSNLLFPHLNLSCTFLIQFLCEILCHLINMKCIHVYDMIRSQFVTQNSISLGEDQWIGQELSTTTLLIDSLLLESMKTFSYKFISCGHLTQYEFWNLICMLA